MNKTINKSKQIYIYMYIYERKKKVNKYVDQ